jgi:hypothetical protein
MAAWGATFFQGQTGITSIAGQKIPVKDVLFIITRQILVR